MNDGNGGGNGGGHDARALVFRPLRLGALTLRNRLIRSATYEGLGDRQGMPRVEELTRLYCDLASGGIGAIVTGFTAVSQDGRAMHSGQCGFDSEAKADAWRRVREAVRACDPDVPMIAQLAHTGRQTLETATGKPVVGASSRACTYFRQPVHALDEVGIERIIEAFAAAALRARDAGFDGVQIHAAHGYLIHQFLSPWTNRREDRWGEKDRFCLEVVERVRERCGPGFSVWIKLSGEEDRTPGVRIADTVRTAQRLESAGVDLLEVSYGTMETALNIIRGACPVNVILKVNPLFSHISPHWRPLWKAVVGPKHLYRLKRFTPNYNLAAATAVKEAVSVPVAVVGGIRSLDDAIQCLQGSGGPGLDAVGLCRPLIREPDLPARWRNGAASKSTCTNCNLCTVYCDGAVPTECRTPHRAADKGRSS
ncbi:NADH:flavin oxidoreductase [bacterium]|nr:NADH:flavin oxidoreductase [bacterium]